MNRFIPLILLFTTTSVCAKPVSWFVENADENYVASVAYFSGVVETIHDVGFAGMCVDYSEIPEIDFLFDRFVGTLRRGRDNDDLWRGSVVAAYAGFMAGKYGLKEAGMDGVCHYQAEN